MVAAAFLLYADVRVDYSHEADFARYHTYSWIKVQAQDPLWNDRIQRAVDNELTSKGWQRVPSGGDAALTAYGSTKTEQTLQTWYDGFGGGWGWRGLGGVGMATTTTENTPVGTLMVDIFDASTKQLIWRGSSIATLSGNPEKNVKKLDKDVADMFKKFPPESKG
jgi:hypothetical protein